MSQFDYDLFVIGGGSGGVRAARKAAETGARVAIAEYDRFGGTCVIRGCVPKKLFVYASHFSESFEDAAGYGWSVGETVFDWATLIANKDKEISRLEEIYRTNVTKAGATIFDSHARLVDPHTIALDRLDKSVTAERILIATGGRPNPHQALPGHEHCMTSNDTFHLETLPEKIIIAGGGYIAVEFAGIFNGLGVETTLLYRGKEILGRFDMDIRRMLHAEYVNKGIEIICHQIFTSVEKLESGKLRTTFSGGEVREVDQVLLAVGRQPNTESLGLEDAGVAVDQKGCVIVDDYSQTCVENIWAIGDVTDRVQLTPVAIHEAMCFVQTVFHNNPTKPDLDTIPTAVFSQPELATVGLSEDDARQQFASLDIYKSAFRPMQNILAGRSERMLMKLIVDAETDRVLGAHILGPSAGEMAQLLGIALKMGAKKADFDATMAVHPTAAEELVTLAEPTERIRSGETVAA